MRARLFGLYSSSRVPRSPWGGTHFSANIISLVDRRALLTISKQFSCVEGRECAFFLMLFDGRGVVGRIRVPTVDETNLYKNALGEDLLELASQRTMLVAIYIFFKLALICVVTLVRIQSLGILVNKRY